MTVFTWKIIKGRIFSNESILAGYYASFFPYSNRLLKDLNAFKMQKDTELQPVV